LAIIYGTLGTLNMADMQSKVGQLQVKPRPSGKKQAACIWSIWLKAAHAYPIKFWLPKTYASASAPVPALIANMTKVRITDPRLTLYLRNAGELSRILRTPWLWPLGLTNNPYVNHWRVLPAR